MTTNIQKKMSDFFMSSCYALSIAYCALEVPEEYTTEDMLHMVSKCIDGWRLGFIDDDGYVVRPHSFYNFCSGTTNYKDVRHVSVTDIPEEKCIACFEYNKTKHFVVCENGKVIFDPYGTSNCVTKGKVRSIRQFI